MSNAELYDKVVAARLQHALLLEQTLLRLARKLAKGEQEGLRKEYEWYAQQAKSLNTKDLAALGKTFQEVVDEFEGFEDD